MAFFGIIAPAASYLPLVTGNTWNLAGPGGSTMSLKVASVQQFGTVQRAALNFITPWTSYTLLLRSSSAGIQLEGIQYPQARGGYPELLMMFGTGINGQTWNSPYMSSTLVSSSNVITTPYATYSNVRRYDVTFQGSAPQTWYLAPNVGLVQFGTSGPMKLTNLTLNTDSTTPGPSVNGPCPLVSITANPAANGNFSDSGKEAVLRNTLSSGSNFLTISSSWAELEPSPHKYVFSSITTPMGWAAKYNLNAVLTIKTIDTSSLALPSDLSGKSWTDPVLIIRWQAFLQALASNLNANVKWINLGNEVDTYLTANPSQLQSYASFFLTGATTLATYGSKASLGLVFSFDSYRLNDSVFRALAPFCAHLSFTYYDQDPISTTTTVRDPSNVVYDLSDMISAAAGRNLVLTEVGFPSAIGAGSSPAMQQTFYISSLAAFKAASGKLTAANFAFLSDFPSATNASLTSAFSSTLFSSWIASLGVMDQLGIAKPAWTSFQSIAPSFLTANACTTN